jgi:hypothetical protein
MYLHVTMVQQLTLSDSSQLLAASLVPTSSAGLGIVSAPPSIDPLLAFPIHATVLPTSES